MPYNRPGLMQYVTATKPAVHGLPVTEEGFVGVAVKQKEPTFGALDAATRQGIIIGEPFAIITKGIVQVAAVAGATRGAHMYIHAANNTLTTDNTDIKYGQVVEVAGQRGTPVGQVRIDLDKKDAF